MTGFFDLIAPDGTVVRSRVQITPATPDAPPGFRWVPSPTPSPTQSDYESAVQAKLDAEARARGYDSILSACSYADDPTVARFQAEGQAFRAWRSQVWAYCYEVLADVQEGRLAQPEVGYFVESLPALKIAA